MSKISANDSGAVDDQINDEEDHYIVDLPPCKRSSDPSPKLPDSILDEVPDSSPGVQYSNKAANMFRPNDGKELPDGDEESGRGDFNYFTPTEPDTRVQITSHTFNYDEAIEIESDKSSIESPRSDGSSTQEYDVTQPEEYYEEKEMKEIKEMKSLGLSSGGDRHSYSSCHDDAGNNPHRQLYGARVLAPMTFPNSGKSSTRVDDTVSFPLNRTEGSIRYSRQYKAEDLDNCHQPPFGEGEGTFSKVGNSIGPLLASHSDPVENLPPGEEIKQNGGLEGDTRKRRKKKKAGQGSKDDTSVGGQQQQQQPEPKEEYLDCNGNPRSYKELRESPSRHQEGSKAANPTTSKSPLSLGPGQQVESDLHKTEPPSQGTLTANSQSTESRAALSGDRPVGKSRRKTRKDVTVVSQDIAGYMGNNDLETILEYVNLPTPDNKKGGGGGNKKGVANTVGKVNNKSESVKKEKLAQHTNPMPREIGVKDGPVREGVENMGVAHSYLGSSANDASSAMSVLTGDAGDIPVASQEKPAEKVLVCKTAEEGTELRRNKGKNSTKQSNDKPVENNNVKKANKGEGASKANKKMEKDGAGAGSNKKAKAALEPAKDETVPAMESPVTVDLAPTFDPKTNSVDYKFTDLDSLHPPKMESDFQPVTKKKKKQRLAMKEPVQPFHNNYHKTYCPQRAPSPPLSEGVMGEKSGTYDFSLTGFPALAKKTGASQKPGLQHVRRNSIGEVPVDPSPPAQDDSDIESVKSLPAAQCAWIGESVNPRPLSYAKMAASKPEGPGPSPEGGRSGTQKTTVWKGSVTERRHSIGSKPEKQRQDSGGGGDLRSRHKSGSQEVLKTDDKECVGVSRNQAEPAVATADAPRDPGLPAPNTEQDFPRLQVSSAPLAAPHEAAKVQPPVALVQSSLHSPSSQNSEGIPPSASAAAAPSLVKVSNSAAAPARSQNAGVVSSVSDTSSPAARSQPQPGEAVEGGQDCRRSKPLAAKAPNNGRKQPVFFCDRKSGNEPQNLGITFGFDSSMDVQQAPQEVPQQSSSHHQMVTFGMEQGDGPDTATLLAAISHAPLSQPPHPPSQHALSVSDSSKAKLGRMNGVVSSACKQLEGSGGGVTVAPVQIPTARPSDVGQAVPSVGQPAPGVGQGAPGVLGQPGVSCSGQGVSSLTGQGVPPGVSGVGTGRHPAPGAGGQAPQGAAGQGTRQGRLVPYGTLVKPANGADPTPRFIEFREIPDSVGNFNLEDSVAFFQRMWDRAMNAKNSDGSPSLVYLAD